MWLKSAAVFLDESSPSHRHSGREPPSSEEMPLAPTPASVRSGRPRSRSRRPQSKLELVLYAYLRAPLAFGAAALALLVLSFALGRGSCTSCLPVPSGDALLANDRQLSDARAATEIAVSQLDGLRRQCAPSEMSSCMLCAECCDDSSAVALQLSLAEAKLLRSRLRASESERFRAERWASSKSNEGWFSGPLSFFYWALLGYAAFTVYASRRNISSTLF